MSRIGYTPAYDAEKSHAYHRGIEDRHRLRQIVADHRWKIVRLSAAQSRSPGIDRRGRRRKSRGCSVTGKAVKFITKPLATRARLRPGEGTQSRGRMSSRARAGE